MDCRLSSQAVIRNNIVTERIAKPCNRRVEILGSDSEGSGPAGEEAPQDLMP